MSSLGMRALQPSLLLFVFIGLFCPVLWGQTGYFEQSEVLREAYLLTLDLRLEEAQIKCESSRTQDPDNLLVEHISSYVDFLKAFISLDHTILLHKLKYCVIERTALSLFKSYLN